MVEGAEKIRSTAAILEQVEGNYKLIALQLLERQSMEQVHLIRELSPNCFKLHCIRLPKEDEVFFGNGDLDSSTASRKTKFFWEFIRQQYGLQIFDLVIFLSHNFCQAYMFFLDTNGFHGTENVFGEAYKVTPQFSIFFKNIGLTLKAIDFLYSRHVLRSDTESETMFSEEGNWVPSSFPVSK